MNVQCLSLSFALVFLTACNSSFIKTTDLQTKHDHLEQTEKSPQCKDPAYIALECADTVTATFDNDRTLWTAYVLANHLYLQFSTDQGKRFSAPVQVNQEAENIAANGEYRPKIKFDQQGNLFLTWTQALEKRHTGHVRFSRSMDHGKSFSTPVTINDNLDIISHRFDDLLIGQNGEIFIAWLDARDKELAKKTQHDFLGTTVYYTWSKDHGASFEPNRPVHEHSCECCRLAVALDKDNLPVVVWRHVFEGQIRDQAIIKFKDWNTPGDLQRASVDNWKIEACPHHGPSMAISETGRYHLSWFSGATDHQGLFYAYSDDQGKNFSDAYPFGNSGAKHPYIASVNEHVVIIWSEFDGKQNLMQMIQSHDGGQHWSSATSISSSQGKSDYGFLLTDGDDIYLSWQTAAGYHLQIIE